MFQHLSYHRNSYSMLSLFLSMIMFLFAVCVGVVVESGRWRPCVLRGFVAVSHMLHAGANRAGHWVDPRVSEGAEQHGSAVSAAARADGALRGIHGDLVPLLRVPGVLRHDEYACGRLHRSQL